MADGESKVKKTNVLILKKNNKNKQRNSNGHWLCCHWPNRSNREISSKFIEKTDKESQEFK